MQHRTRRTRVIGCIGYSPLILYSPVSWLLPLPMLKAEDALEPTVSTRSKPGCWLTSSGRWFSSWAVEPGRRAKGFLMGMMKAWAMRWVCAVEFRENCPRLNMKLKRRRRRANAIGSDKPDSMIRCVENRRRTTEVSVAIVLSRSRMKQALSRNRVS